MDVQLSLGDRSEALARLGAEEFDLLIVGGGLTAAALALDAAARNVRTALIAAGDFGGGVPELVFHGIRTAWGQRTGGGDAEAEATLVAETLAPTIARPVELAVGGAAGGSLIGRLFGGGGRAGDALGERVAALRGTTLRAQMQNDFRIDPTRMTLTVLKHARGRDAVIANGLRITAFQARTERTGGVTVQDEDSGDTIDLRARFIVLAVGSALDDVLRVRDSEQESRVTPARVTHIVLAAERLPTTTAFAVPAPEGRSISAVPWRNRVVAGVSAAIPADAGGAVRAEAGDLAFLLDALNAAGPGLDLTPGDVIAAPTELLPVIDAPRSNPLRGLHADHVIDLGEGLFVVERGPSTSARRVAERVIDGILRELHYAQRGREFRRSATRELRLTGPYREVDASDVPTDVIQNLAETYGHDAAALLETPGGSARVAEGAAPVWGEIDLATEHEMAQHVSDVVTHRTGLAMQDPAAAASVLGAVSDRMGDALGWDEPRRAQEVERAAQAIEHLRGPAS